MAKTISCDISFWDYIYHNTINSIWIYNNPIIQQDVNFIFTFVLAPSNRYHYEQNLLLQCQDLGYTKLTAHDNSGEDKEVLIWCVAKDLNAED